MLWGQNSNSVNQNQKEKRNGKKISRDPLCSLFELQLSFVHINFPLWFKAIDLSLELKLIFITLINHKSEEKKKSDELHCTQPKSKIGITL